MPDPVSSVLGLIQAVAGAVTALTVVYYVVQVRQTNAQIRKGRDKTSIEFILDAEGQFDGTWEAIMGEDADVIRKAVPHELLPDWTDDEVKAFVFLRRRYGHIARIVFIVTDTAIDMGMSDEKREVFLAPWRADLMMFKDNPIMCHIHRVATKNKTTTPAMLDLCRSVFGEPPTSAPS
jgi:hypothetical protein